MQFIWFLLIGAFIGWIAGLIWKGHGFGLFGNIIVGVLGAIIGGWIFDLFGVGASNGLGSILISVVGAIVLLFIAGLIRGGTKP